ncbi:MAG: hypothetical protein Q4P07_06970 [Ornithinimicrobium sp.]|uniref:hypothetical protein n=1 Tax=Ornithinimicrobium sp. TaxID=1977084 RepID=UPI0026DEA7D0|nr:hypothetical protein [Ornithinimicrobium sp.]MDO5739875.1 hypothetical protein [Ornithinimicrobium sp.]
MRKHTAFWEDLSRDLQDPEFLREYVVESMRISTIDSVVNAIDDARAAAGLSKAELARAIDKEPATIRRLLSSESGQPDPGHACRGGGRPRAAHHCRAHPQGRKKPDHPALARGSDSRPDQARRASAHVAYAQDGASGLTDRGFVCGTPAQPADRGVVGLRQRRPDGLVPPVNDIQQRLVWPSAT